jgi:hypothetical protein
MCDYSLHGLPNRLARDGEELVAHRFSTGAIGLTSPAELCRAVNLMNKSEKKTFWSAIKALILPPAWPEAPAVCIPPGARLRMMDSGQSATGAGRWSRRGGHIYTDNGHAEHLSRRRAIRKRPAGAAAGAKRRPACSRTFTWAGGRRRLSHGEGGKRSPGLKPVTSQHGIFWRVKAGVCGWNRLRH